MDISVRSAKGFVVILGAGVLAGIALAFYTQFVEPKIRQALMRAA
jgi:hypothetical protein